MISYVNVDGVLYYEATPTIILTAMSAYHLNSDLSSPHVVLLQKKINDWYVLSVSFRHLHHLSSFPGDV